MSNRANDQSLGQDAAHMEQVRELLFGQQLKDMEVRFRRQEERLLREISDMRDALKKRMDSLENFMKSESSTLLHRLREEASERSEIIKAEQRERNEAIRNEQRERAEAFKNEQRERLEATAQFGRDLAATTETFERKIAKISNTLDTTERELRQLLLTESGSLNDKIEEKYQDALNVISRTAAQIRDDMVYRTALSGMFTETALKLSGQWGAEMDPMAMSPEDGSMGEPLYESAEGYEAGTDYGAGTDYDPGTE